MKLETRLIYDIASCPMSAGLTMTEVVDIYHKQGIAFYDSQQTPGCQKPEIINIPAGTDLKVLDMRSDEGLDLFNSLTKN